MNHRGTVEILIQRLLLRQFVQNDAAMAFRNWTGDEKATEFLRWAIHRSLETTANVMRQAKRYYSVNR